MLDLKIESVEIEGFRSFAEKSIITFPENGIVLISGKYSGSTMSSGSGKSSVMLAVAFCLGYCDLPATDLQSWYSDKMSVSVNLTRGDCKYKVQRSPKLVLFKNDEQVKGSAKELEAELDKILGIDRSLVELLTYRKQRSFGTFLSSTDSERKSLLTKLLNLQKIEDTHKKISTVVQTKQNSIKTLTLMVNNDKQRAETFAATCQNHEAQKKAFEAAAVAFKNASLPSDLEEKKRSLEIISKQLNELNQKTYKIQALRSANETLKSQMVSLDNDLKKAKDKICPTCTREWHSGELETYISRVEQRLSSMAQEGTKNVAELKRLSEEVLLIPDLSQRRDKLTMDINNQSKDYSTALAIYNSAKSGLEATTSAFNMVEKLKADIEKNSKEIETISSDLSILSLLENAFSRNGFLGVIFDEVLVEIEQRANEMIAMIPNVSCFSCSVSGTTETKSGDQKKNITVKLSKDGIEVSPKSLSGGQTCAMELCLDLALIETIRRRTGSSLGWICLDEVMDGLGVEEKRNALEMISNKLTGQILMIDHSTEIKEGFQKIIEIEFDGRTSRAT